MTVAGLPVGVVLLVALSACATAPRSPSGGGDLVVHVENNIAPPEAVRVWLVGADGAERDLGSTPATSAKLWRIRNAPATTRYRLMARRPDSATVISRPFDLGPLEVVRWNIALNSVETARLQRGSDPFLELFEPPPREVAGGRIAHAAPATHAPAPEMPGRGRSADR
jgi:hypothetical protein